VVFFAFLEGGKRDQPPVGRPVQNDVSFDVQRRIVAVVLAVPERTAIRARAVPDALPLETERPRQLQIDLVREHLARRDVDRVARHGADRAPDAIAPTWTEAEHVRERISGTPKPHGEGAHGATETPGAALSPPDHRPEPTEAREAHAK